MSFRTAAQRILRTSACISTAGVPASAARVAQTQAATTRSFVSASQPLQAPKKGADAAPKKRTSAFSKKGRKAGGKFAGKGRKDGGGSGNVGRNNPEFFAEDPDLNYLTVLHPEHLTSANVGKAMVFPHRAIKAFKTFGLPKNVQDHYAFQQTPVSVFREVTLSAVDRLDKAATASSRNSRDILVGASGVGKSLLMMQLVSYALDRSWIVLYSPSLIDWISSSTPYTYSPALRTYAQNPLASQLLSTLLSVNEKALSEIPLKFDVDLGAAGSVQAGKSLLDLVKRGTASWGESGAAIEATRQQALDKALDILARQTIRPVLWAMDDFQCLFRTSKYRDPDFKPLESYHLSVPRTALEYATGRKFFARGAVIGSLSTENTSYLPPPELLSGLGLSTLVDHSTTSLTSGATPPSPSLPLLTPYTRLQPIHLENARSGFKVVDLGKGFSVDEAASAFEVWRNNRMMHVDPSDELFLQKFVEAAGNPRRFERLLRTTLM